MAYHPPGNDAGLFRIGLKPLDPAEWIDADANLAAYLDEKERLGTLHPERVFAAEAGTEDAQTEILQFLAAYLPGRFPEIYRRTGDIIEIVPAGRRVALEEPGVAPLWIAAQLVQEDLLIMRRGEDAWRLVAASLSFPSSWSLAEKFGKPLHEIHKPVPGFGPNTRNAALIARIFDNLQVEIPVLRWNFSLYGDGELHHSEPGNPRGRGFGDDPASIFFRVERQTIRKLAVSGDILFTVRIYAEPLSVLAAQPDGAAIAAWLADRLDALDADQLAYKGLTDERGKLVRRLWEIAGG